MTHAPQWLLIGAVAAVGVLHTMVPDHWLPIALIARQRGWSKAKAARTALQAGTGHVLSTLAIALVVWLAGMDAARHFGRTVDAVSSLALIAFGAWIALAARREQRREQQEPAGPQRDAKTRAALVLILGSSPMLEGIPAFFAAGKYGARLVGVMAVVFAASTIATYVVLTVTSSAGLERIRLRRFEQQGEVLSGLLIALVGVAFGAWSLW